MNIKSFPKRWRKITILSVKAKVKKQMLAVSDELPTYEAQLGAGHWDGRK